MAHKPKTPDELALERAGKKPYSLYLSIKLMDSLKKAAVTSGVSTSDLANEAISFYLNSIKRQR